VDGQRDLDWYIASYDAEILFTDQQVERLTRGLAGTKREWLTMVFSDHGESLSEHGLYLSHSVQLYDTILRIPWIVRWSGHAPAGHVVPTDVMALDIAPTLLGLLGRSAPDSWQGRDLSGCVLDRVPCVPRPSFAVRGDAATAEVAMRSWPEKIICDVADASCELFDLRTDPGEQTDICGARRERCDAMRARVLEWHQRESATTSVAGHRQDLAEDTRAALRALGYTP